MNSREQQLIESYERVQAYIASHPLTAPARYGPAEELLDAVVHALTDHANVQEQGGRFQKASTSNLNTLRKELREQHLRPIAQIARATLRGKPGIDKALSAPGTSVGTKRLLTAASAFLEAAKQYEATFVTQGRPKEFIAALEAAAAAVQQASFGRVRTVGTKVGAGQALRNEIRKGRDAVDVLDVVVREVFAKDSKALGDWENAKKVHASTARKAVTAGSGAPAPTSTAPSSPAVAPPGTPAASSAATSTVPVAGSAPATPKAA